MKCYLIAQAKKKKYIEYIDSQGLERQIIFIQMTNVEIFHTRDLQYVTLNSLVTLNSFNKPVTVHKILKQTGLRVV